MRLLLVEDSRRLRETISKALRRSGYRVDESGDGSDALWKAREVSYDLLVLDVMLPGCDGFEIIETLRREERSVPVLMLTARDSVEDRVNGLRLGADDYLCKPFALEEFLARVDALCRRSYGKSDSKLKLADLEIDQGARQATRSGIPLDLTSRDFALLELLMLNAGKVLSRAKIEEHIYDEMVSPMSNVVDSAIYELRKKLKVKPGLPALIRTRRGHGYVMEEAAT